MADPPSELDGAQVLRYARLTEDVQPTGQTRHYVGDVECEPFAGLAVARYSDATGGGSYYLFYLDEDDNVVTDTDHESMQAALDQAAREYEGTISWIEVEAK